MEYEFEWQYCDDPNECFEGEPYIHFNFMLLFPDVPPGKGHVAHFCFNVLREPATVDPGISVVRRGFIACVPFSKPVVTKFVEEKVTEAFINGTSEEAVTLLNNDFIHEDADFSDEFADDLIEADALLELIYDAFDGVNRHNGISLHQALVIDEYGTQEEFDAAEKLDTESRWQDVPDADISTNTSIYSFLDPIGFRYYLPASMSWAVKNYENDENDCGFYTYLAVLPTVAPREVGRGIGHAFDLESFISQYEFTPSQVNAIYRFIVFMAIKSEVGMDEDYFAATEKWRLAAKHQ